MLIKMKQNRGFTLVELMIVVAIIGILAAVAVPYYQKYIQKSRLTSLLWPGVHIIQSNVSSYYSLSGTFPTTNAEVTQLVADADTTYFAVGFANTALTFTLNKEGNGTNPLHALSGQDLVASVVVNGDGVVRGWSYSGSLASSMGLQGIQ